MTQNKSHTVEQAILYIAWEFTVDLSLVDVKWFYDPVSRRIFEQIIEWDAQSKERDTVLFTMFYKNDFMLMMSGLREFALIPEYWGEYVRLLKKEYFDRRLYEVLEEVKSYEPDNNLKLLKQFVADAESLESVPLKAIGSKEYSAEFMEKLGLRKDIKEPELKTGFYSIDQKLWGLHRGEVVTVGARTSRGKSVFLLNIVSKLLELGKKILYFSTEMSIDDKWSRILSLTTGVEASKFRRANFDLLEWDKITRKSEWLYEKDGFYVCDLVSPTIQQVREVTAKTKPNVVFLDYLGLFKYPKSERNDLAIGEFMKQVKFMSREFNVCSLVASQLNRQVDSREKQIPTLSDLKESGSIEQESDIVLLLYDDDPNKKNDSTRKIICSIEKNRHGDCGLVPIMFYAQNLKMMEV